MSTAHAAGALAKLTVPLLKKFLSLNKAPVGGKKEELQARVAAILAAAPP